MKIKCRIVKWIGFFVEKSAVEWSGGRWSEVKLGEIKKEVKWRVFDLIGLDWSGVVWG